LPAVVVLLLPTAAWSHEAGQHSAPSWVFDPWVLVPLLLSGLLYSLGTIRLWQRARIGRGIRRWQAAAYGLGWLALAGALLSPLHWLGEHLFTAHMIEHESVMAVAAPLLALARPLGAFLWALPAKVRRALATAARLRPLRRSWGLVTSPLPATVFHGVVIWFWHAPAMFDAAVGRCDDPPAATCELPGKRTGLLVGAGAAGRSGVGGAATSSPP